MNGTGLQPVKNFFLSLKKSRKLSYYFYDGFIHGLFRMSVQSLSENAHLPFDRLTALSGTEGLRCPHPSSLRRTSMYASFLGISEALHMSIFSQPLKNKVVGHVLQSGFGAVSDPFLIKSG